jgi:hypothetical protein
MYCSATLALPLPLYRLVFDATFDQNRANETFYPARAAGFGVFMSVILFFWAPLAFWKWFVRMSGIIANVC